MDRRGARTRARGVQGHVAPSSLLPWADRVLVRAEGIVFEEGAVNEALYLIFTGSVYSYGPHSYGVCSCGLYSYGP